MSIEAREFAYENRLAWRAIIVGAIMLVVALGAVRLSEGPTPSRWLLSLATLAVLVFGVKIVRGIQRLVSRSPAVLISEDGIQDVAWGRDPVPWDAVISIKETRVSERLGGIVVFLDAEKMTWMPGPMHLRIANWCRGVRVGQSGKQIVLLMTPSAAIKGEFDDLAEAVERAASEVGKPFERAGGRSR